jgi:hypothetical protein
VLLVKAIQSALTLALVLPWGSNLLEMAPNEEEELRWGRVRHCIDVQAPWAAYLLDGSKTIETRGYALPLRFVGVELGVLVTAAGGGPTPFGGVLAGTITFGPAKQYTRGSWAADSARHLVPSNAAPEQFGWSTDAPKFGWPVVSIRAARYTCVCPPRALQRDFRSLFTLRWPTSGRVYLSRRFRQSLAAVRASCDDVANSADTDERALPENLLVLADFDRTITSGAGEECHDVIFHRVALGNRHLPRPLNATHHHDPATHGWYWPSMDSDLRCALTLTESMPCWPPGSESAWHH